MCNIEKKSMSENFFETGSDLSMIWPTFYVIVSRLSDQIQYLSWLTYLRRPHLVNFDYANLIWILTMFQTS